MKPNIKLWSILFFVIFGSVNYSVAQVIDELQTLVVRSDSTNQCFALYQLDYGKLHFVKSGAKYFAEATVSLEVYDSLRNLYRNEIKRSVFLDDYQTTKDNSKFISFLFKFHLSAGNYTLKSALLFNDESEFVRIKEKRLSIEKNSALNGAFLFISRNKRKKRMDIISFGEVLTFRDNNFTPLYIADEEMSSPKIISKQFGKSISHSFGTNIHTGGISLEARSDSLFLHFIGMKKSKSNYIYSFKDVLSKLLPGSAELILQSNGKTQCNRVTILWVDKPQILNNWEKTLDVLSFIFSEEEMSVLYSSPKKMRIKSLFELWQKYDDNPATAYNPLMVEFFQRVDYAESHFTISKRIDGYKTDMGKIYIRYGKPISVKRKFNTLNLPVEIWNYGGRSYIFVDKNQNGKYELVEVR